MSSLLNESTGEFSANHLRVPASHLDQDALHSKKFIYNLREKFKSSHTRFPSTGGRGSDSTHTWQMTINSDRPVQAKYPAPMPISQPSAKTMIAPMGDRNESIDECNYERELTIQSLKKDHQSIVIPNEIKFKTGYELTADDQKKKDKIRAGKLSKKSQSVMPAKSLLKKKQTIGATGNIDSPQKKVQFSTKKTVFRYNPHR
jgi:hypothetical protein